MKVRDCLLVGGPRDGELREQPGDLVMSLPHLEPLGTYTFKGVVENGVEIWEWKGIKPRW